MNKLNEICFCLLSFNYLETLIIHDVLVVLYCIILQVFLFFNIKYKCLKNT